MGASLGHLVIYNFNITQKEVIMLNDSIDWAVSDPIKKAEKLSSPREIFKNLPTWTKNDLIVTVVSVPLVMPPQAFSLDFEDLDKIKQNDKYTVTAKVMPNEGRYFQDESYDQLTNPYITSISINGITHDFFDFKLLNL